MTSNMLRIQWIRGGPVPLLLALALPLGAQTTVTMAPTAAVNGAIERMPLTLAEAEAEALRGNRDLEAAEARRDAVDARARGSEAFLWPGLQANAGVLRTTDPVGVFGTKLRQERFTEMDFALPGLNQPDAVNDWTAGVGASWQIASPSRWFERGAARAGADAAGFSVQRTQEAVVFQTRVLYLRAIQAAGTLQAAQVALEAAQATAERVSRRVDEGMATEADRLQARAAASQAEAQVELAQAAVDDAADALGAHLGWGPERLPVPAETEPAFDLEARPDADDPSSAGLLERADLRASALGVQAVQAQARAVGAARLPSIEAFGQASAHTPAFDDATGTNWTVGVQLSLPIFTGFGLAAQHDAARAEARAAGAEHAQRVQQANVEVRAARRGLDAAQQALTAVEAAQQAATEAVRLLRRRHEEGMTTLADLLQAEARAAQLDARLVEARTGVLMARAYLDFAWGDAR
jgi:outer membrane protein TolC